MTPSVTLSLTGDQYERLKGLLFPGDGKECVAIALCKRRAGERRHRLVVRTIEPLPPQGYTERSCVRVTWSPEAIAEFLDRAASEKLSVIKIHSHPNGYADFSETDDIGDRRLLPMIKGWVEAEIPHGSAVLLPDGQMFGRVLTDEGALEPISAITVVGDDLHFWYPDVGTVAAIPNFTASHAQIFDEGTIHRMQRLSAAVIGASGTGSPVVEQLMRLGIAEIVSVDPDQMEERNVNRILNSTMQDVRDARKKVDVLGDAVERAGLGTRVVRIAKDLWDAEVVRAVAECDVVFGCMDSIDGRYLLNTLATYYTLPYFDIGVRIEAIKCFRDLDLHCVTPSLAEEGGSDDRLDDPEWLFWMLHQRETAREAIAWINLIEHEGGCGPADVCHRVDLLTDERLDK